MVNYLLRVGFQFAAKSLIGWWFCVKPSMNLELLLSQGQPDSKLLTSAESRPLFDLRSLLVFGEFNGDSHPSNSLQFKHFSSQG